MSTPEYDKEFVEAHISHVYTHAWMLLYKADTDGKKTMSYTMLETCKLLASNMELDINFDMLELEIDLQYLQQE